MTSKPRELFSNNKITEAICQFSFKSFISPDFYTSFKDRVKEKYPEVQELPLFHFNLNPADVQNPQTVPSKSLRISNAKKDKIIQVFPNNLSIHQVGNYHTWETFRDDIYYVLGEYQKDVSAEIGRIDLRTINVFDFQMKFNPADYFNVVMHYPKEFIQHSNYQFNLEQVYEPGSSSGVIRGNCIEQPNNMKFMLDLSYVKTFLDKAPKTDDTVEISSSLEDGHIKLYQLFLQSITNETKKLIK